MTVNSIPRAAFVSAIEAGIATAGDALTNTEIAALRVIGAVAPNVAVGNFKVDGYTCPLCSAGIWDGCSIPTDERHDGLCRFYVGFDGIASPYTDGGDPDRLNVEDS
jgi:hypothetical protein